VVVAAAEEEAGEANMAEDTITANKIRGSRATITAEAEEEVVVIMAERIGITTIETAAKQLPRTSKTLRQNVEKYLGYFFCLYNPKLQSF
jgi:hypothetical protein